MIGLVTPSISSARDLDVEGKFTEKYVRIHENCGEPFEVTRTIDCPTERRWNVCVKAVSATGRWVARDCEYSSPPYVDKCTFTGAITAAASVKPVGPTCKFKLQISQPEWSERFSVELLDADGYLVYSLSVTPGVDGTGAANFTSRECDSIVRARVFGARQQPGGNNESKCEWQ